MIKVSPFCPFLFVVLSIPAFIVLYLFTAIVVLLILILSLFKGKKAVKYLLVFWSRTCFLLMFKRLRIKGKQHINSKEKYILVANHASLFDIIAIMAFFPKVSFFGRAYLTKIPVFGSVLKMIDFVPMKSTDLRNTRSMMDQLEEKAAKGSVAIFPEGTRTRTGELNRFRKGFIRLARATGYPVLPITLEGFFSFKPANRFCINFTTPLGVTIHPPIRSADLDGLNDHEFTEEVKGVIASSY